MCIRSSTKVGVAAPNLFARTCMYTCVRGATMCVVSHMHRTCRRWVVARQHGMGRGMGHGMSRGMGHGMGRGTGRRQHGMGRGTGRRGARVRRLQRRA